MRTITNWVLGAIALLLVLALAVFVAQNVAMLSLHFLGLTFSAPIRLVALAAAAAGLLIALLLTLPGRVLAGHRGRRLDRQVTAREQALQDLQTRFTQLRQQHDQLVNAERQVTLERDRLREELAARQVALQTPQPPVVRTLPRDDARQVARPAAPQDMGQDMGEDTVMRGDGPNPRRIAAATDAADPGAETRASHLSFGERLRELVKGPPSERPVEETPTETPSSDQPTAPLS